MIAGERQHLRDSFFSGSLNDGHKKRLGSICMTIGRSFFSINPEPSSLDSTLARLAAKISHSAQHSEQFVYVYKTLRM
jgi:hypothetical protein